MSLVQVSLVFCSLYTMIYRTTWWVQFAEETSIAIWKFRSGVFSHSPLSFSPGYASHLLSATFYPNPGDSWFYPTWAGLDCSGSDRTWLVWTEASFTGDGRRRPSQASRHDLRRVQAIPSPPPCSPYQPLPSPPPLPPPLPSAPLPLQTPLLSRRLSRLRPSVGCRSSRKSSLFARRSDSLSCGSWLPSMELPPASQRRWRNFPL